MSVQPARYRFTVHEYERMGATGVFAADDRLELIDGEVVTMAPIGSAHAGCVGRLTRLFSQVVGNRALVWVQNPVRLDERSEAQPDLALLRPRTDFYSAGHPGPDDVLLIVEVADTTVEYDLDVKAPLYARAGIPTTWVVDLAERCVHVLSDPAPSGYTAAERATGEATLSVGGLGGITVTAADMLGRN